MDSTHTENLSAPQRPRPASPAGDRLRRDRMTIRYVSRGLRFMDLGFWFLYGLILMQISLEALGAHDGSGFKRFLDGVTGPFLDPFRGLLDDPAVQDHQIMLSYICALVVYALIQHGLRRLIRAVTESVTGRPLPKRVAE